MKYDRYTIKESNFFRRFEFASQGPKGSVVKWVEFDEYPDYPGVYNLSFGDFQNGYINDAVVTDNRDGEKVLATVSFTVFEFFRKYPNATVCIAGNTAARTRLYRMAIGNNLEILQRDFEIVGVIDEQHYVFKKHGTYTSFKIKKRTT